jgi:hypothetical protein
MEAYSRFRHLAIEGAKPAPTDAQLAAIETLLGASLPLSFREFLSVANGGSLEYVVDVPMADGTSEQLSFCGIFSAEEGDFCDETLLGEIRSGREHHGLPEGVLPFARDGGGSAVFLDLSAEGNGRVVAFVQGLPAWTGRREDSAFIELSSSFDEYVQKLRIDREAALDHLRYDATELPHVEAIEEWLDIGLPAWREEDSELRQAADEARRRVTVA